MIQSKFNLLNSEITLTDLDPGVGKIELKTPFGNFDYTWGAMGDDIKTFLTRINEQYFTMKVNRYDRGVFCGKRTVREVRRFIKSEGLLPWYEQMEEQKLLRKRLKEIATLETAEGFVHAMSDLPSTASNNDYAARLNKPKTGYQLALEALSDEPWHFIVHKPSEATLFLCKLFERLKKAIQRERQKATTLNFVP